MNDDIDREQFEYGYEAYLNGCERPDQFSDTYYQLGWFRAQVDAGLDHVSLDKLSKQLKALGFTIPND
jgi:hypothetical protein